MKQPEDYRRRHVATSVDVRAYRHGFEIFGRSADLNAGVSAAAAQSNRNMP